MEELFRLKADNLDHLLPQMKRKLMLPDQKSQLDVLHELSELFAAQRYDVRQWIVAKLIKFDLISVLCDIMTSSGEPVTMMVLQYLSWVSEYSIFYEYQAAAGAVISILRVAHCVTMASEKNYSFLLNLLHIIRLLLFRATEFGVNIGGVCDSTQILSFLKKLNTTSLTHHTRFAAADLLNLLLEHSTLEELEKEDEQLLLDVCKESIESIRDVIEHNDEIEFISRGIVSLCSLCACAIRFCGEDYLDNTEEEGLESLTLVKHKSSLAKSIYSAVISSIAPHLKDIILEEEIASRCHQKFVSCVNSIYRMKDYRHNDLANHLTANGYLKYFLQLSINLNGHVRRSFCILLTQTLTILAKYSLSIEEETENWNSFSNLIFDGLHSLPKDVDQLLYIQELINNSSTALIILLYYHYHGTQEQSMISLKSLIKKIIRLSESNCKSISVAILKPLWFLFAVSSLSHSCLSSYSDYTTAVRKLASVLQCSEPNRFYTHHIVLLHFCLACPDVSNDLKYKVMSLWLTESKGDILPLLELNCHNVIRRSLLNIIQIGYPETVADFAVKAIRQLIQVDKCEEIAEIAWNMLPKILATYVSNKVVPIKAMLELCSMSEPRCLSTGNMRSCANGLINIFLTEDTDLELKTLIVQETYSLLVVAIARNYRKMLLKYANNLQMLEKLYSLGYSEEKPMLAAICLKFLAFVVHCQSRVAVKYTKGMEIELKDLYKLLLQTQKFECTCVNALQLFHELLSITQSTGKLAVTLKSIQNNAGEAEIIVDLYELLHIVHWKSIPEHRDLVYECLVNLLRFCHTKAEPLMYHLCSLISNYELVITMTKLRHESSAFLNFLTTWLRYRKRYADEEIAWNCESLFKSPFDETMEQLMEYKRSLKAKGKYDAYTTLHYATSLFDSYEEVNQNSENLP